jgi:polyhydroxyalkanoate synthase subunit PhaC
MLVFLEVTQTARPACQQQERTLADKRLQPTWDPIALAAQLRNIAEQNQLLMQRIVSHQPDAINFEMGTSTLRFDFFERMTRMMTDPVAVARAQPPFGAD